MRLLADIEAQTLRKLAANSDDIDLQEDINKYIAKYLPLHYSFTIANSNGEVLYDDFGTFVGEQCRSDLRDFSNSTHTQDIYIHPGPGKYHFDIMVPWNYSPSESGILFVSFNPHLLARILNNSQIAGHRLYLIRSDTPDLIEIDNSGSRDILQREIRLSSDEINSIAYFKQVPETRWLLVDIPDGNTISAVQMENRIQAFIAFSGIALMAIIMSLFIRRAEKQRRRIEWELRCSRDQMEKRVDERTEELLSSNEELQREITERIRIESSTSAQQNILRLIAAGEPLDHVLELLSKTIEAQSENAHCIIMLYDKDSNCLRLAAAPTLPTPVQDNIQKIGVGLHSGACGLAALKLEPIIVKDIDNYPAYDGIRDIVHDCGLSASISHPILRSDDSLLGTICLMFSEKREPSDDELQTLQSACNIAEIAIERNQAENQRLKLSSAIEQTDDAIIITDKNGIIEYINPAFVHMTGYSLSEATGKKPSILKSGIHDNGFYQNLWDTILRGEVFRNVFTNKRKNGSQFYEEQTITPIKNDNGDITHFVSTGKDISERMETQEKLQFLAHHDVLTNLPNRALLRDRLEHAFNLAERNESLVAILFLDLDRFKHINDSLGHNVGDILLKKVSDRLKTAMRKTDTIARLGGDEFTVVLEDIKHVDGASSAAQKIINALQPPFTILGHEITVNASIGITIYPFDDSNIDNLLKNADTAMYRAKGDGGNAYRFFTADMMEHTIRRLELENKLRRALEREQFILHYQPRMDIVSGQIHGVEALIRWQDPDEGLVPPNEFIPLLEETGLIIPVGAWVLTNACAFSQALKRTGLAPLRIGINLSVRQFREDSLVTMISQIMKHAQLDPKFLELEITESLLMENIDSVSASLEELHNMGIQISLDDFGTGYSSMSYLKKFPFTRIKIDRSFVRDITTDPDDAALVEAIIAMAHSMRLEVTAEGVETTEQLEFLSQRKCNEAQGYLISKPMPLNEIIDWLKKNTMRSNVARPL